MEGVSIKSRVSTLQTPLSKFGVSLSNGTKEMLRAGSVDLSEKLGVSQEKLGASN